MANGVSKRVYSQVFGRSKQLSQNKFFDPSTPSIRKVDDGEKKRRKKKEEKKRIKKEKNGVFSGHYVIAISLPPERQLLERRTLVPIFQFNLLNILVRGAAALLYKIPP